jgi:hypothetical protein
MSRQPKDVAMPALIFATDLTEAAQKVCAKVA